MLKISIEKSYTFREYYLLLSDGIVLAMSPDIEFLFDFLSICQKYDMLHQMLPYSEREKRVVENKMYEYYDFDIYERKYEITK